MFDFLFNIVHQGWIQHHTQYTFLKDIIQTDRTLTSNGIRYVTQLKQNMDYMTSIDFTVFWEVLEISPEILKPLYSSICQDHERNSEFTEILI